MNMYEAFSELDGIDGAAVLSSHALGEILVASRNLAGAWDTLVDGLAEELLGSSGEATLAMLHECAQKLEPHLPELSSQLWGKDAGWADNQSPCTAQDAKVLFGIVQNQKPSMAMLRVKVNGATLTPGGDIPVGSTVAIEGRGFGYDPNLIFVSFRNRANPKDHWDFRVDAGALESRSLRLDTPVPGLGVGTSVDVLVGTGFLSRSSGVADPDGIYAGKVSGAFGEYAECGAFGTLVAGA
jgi:hypothetical protein